MSFLHLFSLASCNPECENGGVCSGPNICDCPPGYRGNRCQTQTCMLQKVIAQKAIAYIFLGEDYD